MNFLNAKELQNHAMKCRYGWRRFFKVRVDLDIIETVFATIARIERKDFEFDEHQARLDFVRKFPIKD